MCFLIMQHQASWKTQMRHLDAKYVIFSIVVYVCGLFLPLKMVMYSQQISVRTSIILIAALQVFIIGILRWYVLNTVDMNDYNYIFESLRCFINFKSMVLIISSLMLTTRFDDRCSKILLLRNIFIMFKIFLNS